MRKLLLHSLLPVLLASALGVQPALADIYTWIDESGRVNVSNLPPPAGAKVIKVVKDVAPPAPQANPAREAALRDAEVQALAERVRQLQEEVSLTRSLPPAPPVVYPIVVQMPVQQPQYVVYEAPQPAPVAQYPAPAAYNGCDFGWSGCYGWWGTSFYPSNVVVVRDGKAPRFRDLQGIYPIYQPRAHQPIANAPGFPGIGPGRGGVGGGGGRGGGRRG